MGDDALNVEIVSGAAALDALAAEQPRIVELRVQGAGRADKADMLAVIAALLGAHGFEPCPVDRALPCLDVILPADWRDLPIARAVLAGSPPPAAPGAATSPARGGGWETGGAP